MFSVTYQPDGVVVFTVRGKPVITAVPRGGAYDVLDAHGNVLRSAIDWTTVLAFVKELMPIILAIIAAFKKS